ncbi:hypothetical protein ED28_10135 [[Pantoea] beijingensis]|uniref:UPF0319 protein ED28_10135 n=1 Tax=[Pantoea] beijingensis TaxID=1324864 RepID=A0A443ICY6_9GAMM|nr:MULTISPECIES: DUF2057 family protein [Erwiniaceae]RWR01984.1 hypothetical protein ED28_10135 [[Pantoea] beijingensis]
MKLHLVLSGLLALLVAASCQATTLKLAPEIDLLVLDGRKISGSLLRGAEGLELERGEHQLLFRVEKTLHQPPHSVEKLYVSVPLIVTFDTQVKSVSIQLPPLNNLRDGKIFNKAPTFHLVDESNNVLATKRDRLMLAPDVDVEQAMVAYNRDQKVASVPRFAVPQSITHVQRFFPTDIASNASSAERLLQLWYHQVDTATRQRLILWMKALRAC